MNKNPSGISDGASLIQYSITGSKVWEVQILEP